MKLEMKCENCKKNMFEFKENCYNVYVNNKLTTLCQTCINKAINKSYDRIEFYLVNDLVNFKLINLPLYSLKLKEGIELDEIIYYNQLKDNKKKKVRSFLLNYFGGKKHLQNKFVIKDFDFKIKLIREEKYKCSICGKQLPNFFYFLKKGNQLNLVCYECYKRSV